MASFKASFLILVLLFSSEVLCRELTENSNEMQQKDARLKSKKDVEGGGYGYGWQVHYTPGYYAGGYYGRRGSYQSGYYGSNGYFPGGYGYQYNNYGRGSYSYIP